MTITALSDLPRHLCTAEGAIRCPDRAIVEIDGDWWCEKHAQWLIEDELTEQEASA